MKNEKLVMRELAAAGVTTLGAYVKLLADNEGHPARLKAMGIDTGEAGGFALPEHFSSRIMAGAPPAQALIRPRATVVSSIDAPDGKVGLPALRWGAGGVYGNVTFVQSFEGTAGQSDDPKFDGVMMEPRRTSAFFTIGNSLLRNVPAMNTVIETIFRNSKSAYEENLFLQGIGSPQGIVTAPCGVRVPRATAGTIKYADVVGMFLRSYGTPIWIASMSAMPSIVSLSDENGHAIFSTSGAVPTLLSVPCYFTRRQPSLGSAGDLMLVDASYYLIADGSMFILPSTGPFFTSDLTVIRLTFYLDGHAWLRAPLTLEDGTSASPIVVLQ